ncbi:hypothetical protein F441_14048 [Phytophthora nicotianae CJ01A1]|uniref:Crinkler effector protein N-terminal domain-containing protein n=4 Tax=Phytophthora nicotianae TaxID=4792 RepID=W2YTM2_PHYNI|nr:hypothetical protein L915_13763 [Phytophthora nicotianae]ETO69233.1 hypothetical protein F444_14150 [Phytophthora nicotianae P1976]ETP10276.1 hypothetical protein F441_14048 [Phytophthora nicotianae CJ01A1]ETP38417.1 hypothetical protein F442_13966 [Phytophthora nicotianae P10297]KUF84119.1 hypothetical protein AM587_10017466 [Phytophthora nicotianae]
MEEEEPPTQELHEQECEQEPEPQELELWCLIVGMVGTAFPVIVKGTDRVWELQKTVKNEAVEIYGDFNAAQLRVYLAKKDNGEWLTADEVNSIENGDTGPAKGLLDRGHLASMSRLAAIFKHRDANVVHILVQAPPTNAEIEVQPDISGKRKRSEQSIGDTQTISVSADELSLLCDVLKQDKQTEQNLIATSGLREFWKGYGGFPSSYFVRKEELVLWRLVMRMMSKQDKRVTIVGSAGVGKSCFLVVVGFYLAFIEKRKVLVVRRLNGFSESNCVVYLDGESNTCIKKTNLTAAKISSLSDRKEFQGALTLVDGYSRAEVEHQIGNFPYQLIASSLEDAYSTDEVVLPAWRFNDLLRYAELNLEDWKQMTGLDQEKGKTPLELAQEQYFYSGGSLRDYCRNRTDVKNGIDGVCAIVSSAQTLEMKLEQGPRGYTLWDRIRRHYVVDPNDEEHYWLVCHWEMAMDSGYAFKRIGRFMNEKMQLNLYQVAKNLRAGFEGAAFEQYFHGAVWRSTKRYPIQLVNVVVNSDPSYSNQRYDRLILHGRPVVYTGGTEEECYENLSQLARGEYCHLDNVNFPFVQAVVVCEGILRGSNLKEKVVTMISTAASNTKTFKSELWTKLIKALDRSEHISRSIPRVFVVVGSDASTCKSFTLIDAPDPDSFMVCCYDPLKFLRKPPNARIT